MESASDREGRILIMTDSELNILLVEDHADTIHAMTRLLTSVGYQVQPAACAREALDLARHLPFDLIISDLALPDGSGLDVMRQINEMRPTRGIAISGYDDADHVEQSRQAGFAAHLTKPTDLPCLLAAIQSVTHRHAPDNPN